VAALLADDGLAVAAGRYLTTHLARAWAAVEDTSAAVGWHKAGAAGLCAAGDTYDVTEALATAVSAVADNHMAALVACLRCKEVAHQTVAAVGVPLAVGEELL